LQDTLRRLQHAVPTAIQGGVERRRRQVRDLNRLMTPREGTNTLSSTRHDRHRVPKADTIAEPHDLGGIKMPRDHLFAMKFSKLYPLYVQKAERKNRTKEEVDQIICWLTGYDQAGLRRQIEQANDVETFFVQAPGIHPNSALIKGVVCGVRVEEVQEPLMRKVRQLDKLIDELAKGKAMEKILRQ
jgi:hypothetical protein